MSARLLQCGSCCARCAPWQAQRTWACTLASPGGCSEPAAARLLLPRRRYTGTNGVCKEPKTGHAAVPGSLSVAGYMTIAANKAAIQYAV